MHPSESDVHLAFPRKRSKTTGATTQGSGILRGTKHDLRWGDQSPHTVPCLSLWSVASTSSTSGRHFAQLSTGLQPLVGVRVSQDQANEQSKPSQLRPFLGKASWRPAARDQTTPTNAQISRGNFGQDNAPRPAGTCEKLDFDMAGGSHKIVVQWRPDQLPPPPPRNGRE